MNPAVRMFISPDVDLENFRPDDPENFSFLLQAIVGPADGPGDESLQFIICTPKSLEARLASEPIILGRSLVIVRNPKIDNILHFIKSTIERVETDSWRTAAGILSRMGLYEFEDFV